ncbi:MAG TPA: CAP domain-containing protein [Actinomycetota bacterium]|nr:CAP domain-containing protein [Actinomycetota bacterium]
MHSQLKFLAVLTAAFAIALAAALPAAGESDAGRLTQLHDTERSKHSLSSLARAGDLAGDAQVHAREMAGRGEIYHSGRTSRLEGWYALGENVGWGSDVDEVFRMFMESPSHRANILDGSWDSIGVGVAAGESGEVYVAVLFGDREDAAARPAPQAEQPKKPAVKKQPVKAVKAPERKRVPAAPTPAPSVRTTPIPTPEASAAPEVPAPPAPPVPAEPRPSDASRAVGVLLAVEREHREPLPEEAATIGDVSASTARRLFSESEAERRRQAAARPEGAAARSLGGVARCAWSC